MIIDLKNNRLINVSTIEITDTETKIISLLSDNRYHTVEEIAEFIHYADAYKIVHKLVDKYDFLLHFKHKKGLGYKINEKIYIK